MIDFVLNPMLGLIRSGKHFSITEWAQRHRAIVLPGVLPGAGRFPELCMLPVDVEIDELHSLHQPGEKRIVQLKADGLHGLFLNGPVVSREGGPLDCALHCQPALRRLEEAFGQPMMFDGEYVEDDGFNATIAAQRRGEGQGVFWLFDAMPYADWCSGGSSEPTLARLQALRTHVMAAQSPFVGMLDFWQMDAADTRAKALELFREGYEGIVTKDAVAGYVRARSPLWRRCKARQVADLPVIDVMARDGKLKAIVVRGPDGAKPLRIGSGWSADQAMLIMNNFKMGYPVSVRVRYELTVGTTRSVRGAVFQSLCGDQA